MGTQTDDKLCDPAGQKSKPELIWDEYKYRHEHCWKTLFQVTYAVVLISLVPYTKGEIVRAFAWRTVIVPILATSLAVLGLYRLRRELRRLAIVSQAHSDLQGLAADDGKSSFKRHFTLYLSLLIAAAIANGLMLLLVWVPSLK